MQRDFYEQQFLQQQFTEQVIVPLALEIERIASTESGRDALNAALEGLQLKVKALPVPLPAAEVATPF